MNTIALFERPLLLQVNVFMHYTCVRMPVAAEGLQYNGHFLVAVRCSVLEPQPAVQPWCCGHVVDARLTVTFMLWRSEKVSSSTVADS
jgi:hypothetical protein